MNNIISKIIITLIIALTMCQYSTAQISDDSDMLVSSTPKWDHYWKYDYTYTVAGPLPDIFKNFTFMMENEYASGKIEYDTIVIKHESYWSYRSGAKTEHGFVGYTGTPRLLGNTYLYLVFSSGVNIRENIIEKSETEYFKTEWDPCHQTNKVGKIVIDGNCIPYDIWLCRSPVDCFQNFVSLYNACSTTDYSDLPSAISDITVKTGVDNPDLYLVLNSSYDYSVDLFGFDKYAYSGGIPFETCGIHIRFNVDQPGVYYNNQLYHPFDLSPTTDVGYSVEDLPKGSQYIYAKKLNVHLTADHYGLPITAEGEYDVYITMPTDPEKLEEARACGWLD